MIAVSVFGSILCGFALAQPSTGIDCRVVRCAEPPAPEECASGETGIPDGECCEICVVLPDCSAVACLVPQCNSGVGEVLVTPFGMCCPMCEGEAPDCSAILCPVTTCNTDEIARTPNGECCPVCTQRGTRRRRRRDCSLVLCAQVECQENEVAYVPKGQCCPSCRPNVRTSTDNPCACTDCDGNCGDSLVNCLANPCGLDACADAAEGDVCQSNYCGGCHACCGPAGPAP